MWCGGHALLLRVLMERERETEDDFCREKLEVGAWVEQSRLRGLHGTEAWYSCWRDPWGTQSFCTRTVAWPRTSLFKPAFVFISLSLHSSLTYRSLSHLLISTSLSLSFFLSRPLDYFLFFSKIPFTRKTGQSSERECKKNDMSHTLLHTQTVFLV